MSNYHAEFKHVSREVFNAVSDRIISDRSMNPSINIRFNGSHLYGDMIIDGSAGNQGAYKKALQIFTEEYCK